MARRNTANTESEVKTTRTSNALKIRIDDLKTFDPLTENQKNILRHIRDKIISLLFMVSLAQVKHL